MIKGLWTFLAGLLLWTAAVAWVGICMGVDWVAHQHVAAGNGYGAGALLLAGACLIPQGLSSMLGKVSR